VLFDNRAVWASLSTLAALDALFLVDDRFFVHDRDSASRADVLTAVNDTAPARGSDENAVDRAFVASDIDDFDDVRVSFVAAEREFDTLLKYRAFLIYTATHARLRPRYDLFRNVGVNARHIALVSAFYDFFEYFVFKFLYFRVEYFFHSQLIIVLARYFVK